MRKTYTVTVTVAGCKAPDAGADFVCEDGVMLQALANFLNHVGTKEEIREVEERLHRNDPNLRRDIARAQLLGTTAANIHQPEPDANPGPGEFYGHPGPFAEPDSSTSGTDGVRTDTAEEKLYQDGD